jgi:alpha-D-ribose 1-methylphosphonate 5-triphosphate diphosphatase
MQASRQKPLVIAGGRVLAEGGALAPQTLIVDGGRIAAIEPPRHPVEGALDCAGALVLPGIVDLHGDAFEREIMPRPGVHLPIGAGLLETDRRLVANGVTTAFHGITYSFEPGLRGRAMALRLIEAIEALRPRFACDVRIHLRYEMFNVDGADDVLAWLTAGRIALLAFNDHLALLQAHAAGDDAGAYAGRAGLTIAAFRELLSATERRAADVWPTVERLAAAARVRNVPCLSHDDETIGMRQRFHALGCRISEFPVSAEVAEAARALGDAVVLGAPNVLRGGSHCARLDARAAVAAGLAPILASDYAYAALLYAPFLLAAAGAAPFELAWQRVAAAPAKAAGLADRGIIAEGKRADLIIVDDRDAAHPRVLTTVVAGRIVYDVGLFASQRWATTAEAFA